MQQISSTEDYAPADHAMPAGAPRLRTITGVRFATRCACGCDQPIPRDPTLT